jgi:hypothetical protein
LQIVFVTSVALIMLAANSPQDLVGLQRDDEIGQQRITRGDVVESPPPPPYIPRVGMRIHPEGESCFDIGRVLVLNDSPARAGRT